MSKMEKRTDEIIAEAMKELYDNIEKSKDTEEKDDDIGIVEIEYEDLPKEEPKVVAKKPEPVVEESGG